MRDDVLDLVLGRAAPQAEADSAHADLGSDTHGLENRRQGDLTGMASRTCRCGDVRHPREDVGADVAAERDIERIRQTVLGMAIEDNAIAEHGLEAVP